MLCHDGGGYLLGSYSKDLKNFVVWVQILNKLYLFDCSGSIYPASYLPKHLFDQLLFITFLFRFSGFLGRYRKVGLFELATAGMIRLNCRILLEFFFIVKVILELRHKCVLMLWMDVYFVSLLFILWFFMMLFDWLFFSGPNVLSACSSLIIFAIVLGCACVVSWVFGSTIYLLYFLLLYLKCLLLKFSFEVVDGFPGCPEALQVVIFDVLVVDLTRSILILKVVHCQLIITLPSCVELSLYVVQGGFFQRGLKMLCCLDAFRNLTDIIEIH